jgi:hypothetical protein
VINIPFNFQPESVDVKTSLYTIPSGKYAKVVAYCPVGSQFLIGGTAALISSTAIVNSISDAGTLSATTTIKGAAGGNTVFEGTLRIITGSGNWSLQVGGINILTPTAGTYELKVGPDDNIVLAELLGTDNISYSLVGYEYSRTERDTELTEEFWVTSGTQLNVTGSARFTVMLFNEIS